MNQIDQITNTLREREDRRRPSDEYGYCPVCGHPTREIEGDDRSPCSCLGIWPFSRSSYPGESGLVETHPNNTGEPMFYRREDVDPIIAAARTEEPRLIAALKVAVAKLVHIRDDNEADPIDDPGELAQEAIAAILASLKGEV